MLELLKINLGISVDVYNAMLGHLLAVADAKIREYGITLADDMEQNTAADKQILIMYASWLWSRRQDPVAQMPDSLRIALHQRLFSEKGKVTDD